MPTGVGAIDALFQLGRGIAAMPEGAREEGVGGAFRSFINPRPFEVTKRARGAREDAAAELQQIEQMAEQAKTVDDIAPAFGMIQSLRGQLEASGADADTLQLTLSPTFRKLTSRAFQLVDASDPNSPVKLSQIAIASGGDAGAERGARSLQSIFKTQQEQATSKAAENYYGARSRVAESTLPLNAARTRQADASANRSDRTMPRDPGQPRLTDLDRLRQQITRETTDTLTGTENPAQEPRQSTLAEYNRRGVDLGKPPLRYVPGTGVREITGPAEPVANRLMGPPPGIEALSTAPYQGPPPAEDAGGAQLAQAPAPGRIPIPDVFRQRAASPNPQHALSTSELIAYYRQQGLGPDEARAAARQALAELAGAPGH